MSMLKDEITILKSLMVSLDNDTAMLVTFQYHTETNEYSKVDRSKSKYRYMVRVFKIEDLVKKIAWMREDANRLNKFKWPDDPWPWYICAGYPENWRVADWLACKLKKIKKWKDGQQLLAGFKPATAKQTAHFNDKAKYELNGYLDKDGNEVSITDRNALLKHVGQNLIKVDTKQKKSKIAVSNAASLRKTV